VKARKAKRAKMGEGLAHQTGKRGSEIRPWYDTDFLTDLTSGKIQPVPFVPHPLLEKLGTVLTKMPDAVMAGDKLLSQATRLFWGTGRQVSISVVSEETGVSRRQLVQDQRTLAACLLSCDIQARHTLEAWVSTSSIVFEPVFYVEYDRHDESSMPISVTTTVKAAGFCGGSSASACSTKALAVVDQFTTTLPDSKEIGPAKIVQSIQNFGMVFKKKAAPGSSEADAYFLLVGDSLTALQACDRTIAEVLRHLVKLRSCATLGSRPFRSKARMVTVDRFSGNLKAERALQHDLQWLSLVIGCEAHGVARVHTKALGLMDFDISGAMHLALSVTMAGTMQKFKRCVREVIAERLAWPPLRGQPTVDAEQYRLRCICALTNGWSRASSMQRKALLHMLPSGDWRKRNVVEVYVSPEVKNLPDKELLINNFAHSLAQGLAWHKLAVYPRHRWLGCEAAISQPTLLDACHGLLRPAYQKFCKMVGKWQPSGNAHRQSC